MLVNSILAGAFCRAGIMGAEACRIVLYKILVNKYSACYNMQAYFVYTVKIKRLKCRNTQSRRN